MQRPVSSSCRGGLSERDLEANHHVVDIMQQNTYPVYNRKGIWRRFRSSRGYFTIHFIPLILLFSVFVLWWFSYPVNLEFVDGRLIAARKMELEPELVNQTLNLEFVDGRLIAARKMELEPELVNQTRVDYTILMKKEVTLPPNPSIPQNTTLMNKTSSIPPNPTLMNVTSSVPPNPTLMNLTLWVPPKPILMNDTAEDSPVSSD